MTKMKVHYRKGNGAEIVHESGAKLMTAPPQDVGGKGDAFSPTDLMAASLGSCMLTLMGMAAEKVAFDLTGTTVEVEKVMVVDPMRRIGKIVLRFRIPHVANEMVREKLEKAAVQCPVHYSLHPNVKQEIDFLWGI